MRDLMATHARSVMRRLRSDERGVIGVLVAVLIGGGVLIGIMALVVDVGQLYQERAELQNGADAAALAVAKSCALGTCNPNLAQQLADDNASNLTGGSEGVSLVCGSGNLGVCPPSTGALTDCPSAPAAGTNYVQVYTTTKTASGSTLLPPSFAGALIGESGYAGATVDACAQAEWGAPASADVVALAISACEWDQATQQGTLFGPEPAAGSPTASLDQVLTLNPGNAAGCTTEPAGADGPLTFGWAQDQLGGCRIEENGSTFQGSQGSVQGEPAGDCQTILSNAQANQTPILVAIYVTAVTNGSGNLTYTPVGVASFVVTGYNMPGFAASDWLDSANSCQGTQYCLNGYFIQNVVPTIGSLSGTNLGASIIELTG